MSGEIISQELEVKQFFFKKLSGKSLMEKKISMDDVQVDTPISTESGSTFQQNHAHY